MREESFSIQNFNLNHYYATLVIELGEDNFEDVTDSVNCELMYQSQSYKLSTLCNPSTMGAVGLILILH